MKASLLKNDCQHGLELPRIKCAFHTDQYLTNFCNCTGCLLPLCPSCIKIHINQHINMRTNPQLENINNLLTNLYDELEDYGQKFNNLHKNFVQIQSFVDNFRQKLKNKLYQVKSDLIAAVEEHFKKIQCESLQKINDFKHTKNITKYKQMAKKSIVALKNSERNFFSQESKIMRMIIKYEANGLKSKLQDFCQNSKKLIEMQSQQVFNIGIKDNFAQIAIQHLHSLLQIDLYQFNIPPEPEDITVHIKQLYEKPAEKKQLKKSLYKYLSNKITPLKHFRNQIFQNSSSNLAISENLLTDFAQIVQCNNVMSFAHQKPQQEFEQNYMSNILSEKSFNNPAVYSSVKESIVKATQELNFTLNRNKRMDSQCDRPDNVNRRSMSKGKGIKIVQSVHSKVNNGSASEIRRNGLNQSLVDCEFNLEHLNSRTEQVHRRCR